uniref:DNA-directed RNA polymerase n=1 Tax=viral metagenome TaxID=1070528 RepID=A0A6C0M0W0_9ZZZZ
MNCNETKAIQFSVLSPKEIEGYSVCEITSTSHESNDHTLADARLGPTDSGILCETCGCTSLKCPGHFGHIKLNEPIPHPLFTQTILNILRCVCNSCSTLLLQLEFVEMMNIKPKREKRLRVLVDQCKSVKVCHRCERSVPIREYDSGTYRYYYLPKKGDRKVYIQMPHREVYDILKRIESADFEAMGFNYRLDDGEIYTRQETMPEADMDHRHASRPEWFMMTVIPVLPKCARPSVFVNDEEKPDSLDDQYINILKCNELLSHARNSTIKRRGRRKASELTEAEYDRTLLELEEHISTLIDNSKGHSRLSSGKPHMGLKERIASKEGHLRANVQSKRVDFCGRTVIGGDPTLRMDEIGVPIDMKRTLTIPERVTTLNYSYANTLLDKHEINYVIRHGSKIRVDHVMSSHNERQFALRIGDVIERQIRNGDWIIMNRQPTLRIEGMMAFKIVLLPGSTFRLNLSVTTPFNADFDGDEMNLHLPQDVESIAELMVLMDVKRHIMTAQRNAPVMGIVQDGLIGMFLLTKSETLVPWHLAFDMLVSSGLSDSIADLRTRGAKYGYGWYGSAEMCSGKLLFSALLPRNFYYMSHNESDSSEPTVVIEHGILVKGVVCKKVIGGKSNSIVHHLCLEYSDAIACDFISRTQFMVNRWLAQRGFSVGLSDCLISDDLRADVSVTLADARSKCDSLLEGHGQFMESDIISALNSATSVGQRLAKNGMNGGRDNAFVAIINSGAKGSTINLAQITALVGQQNILGGRLPTELSGGKRAMYHFKRGDRSPEALGFITNNYLQGLKPHEQFAHAVSGREGNMDTAVKTQDSGYSQRRGVKKCEDEKIMGDGSVRSGSDNHIIQYIYGGDGFDAKRLCDTKSGPFFVNLKRVVVRLNGEVETEVPVPLSARDEKRLLDTIRPSTYSKKIAALQQLVLLTQMRLKDQLVDVTVAPSKVEELIEEVSRLYNMALVDSGEMVGIVSACSIGEIGTQLNLNTFHTAGVQHNVTAGIPRLKELTSASHKPHHSSCSIRLDSDELRIEEDAINDLRVSTEVDISERLVAHKLNCIAILERMRKRIQYADVEDFVSRFELQYVATDSEDFFEFAEHIRSLYKHTVYVPAWWCSAYTAFNPSADRPPQRWIVKLWVDLKAMHRMDVSIEEISVAIESLGVCTCIPSPTNIGEIDVYIDFSDAEYTIPKLDLNSSPNTKELLNSSNIYYFYARDIVVKRMMKTRVCGIKGITDLFVRERTVDTRTEWVIDTEGANLEAVTDLDGVDFAHTTCDDMWNVYETLGVEATREFLIEEFKKVLCADGYINERHISILVDTMVCKGTITSAARNGIDRDVGPLAKASFEETVQNFASAAAFGETERMDSVASSITMAKLTNVGTGYVKFGPAPSVVGHRHILTMKPLVAGNCVF